MICKFCNTKIEPGDLYFGLSEGIFSHQSCYNDRYNSGRPIDSHYLNEIERQVRESLSFNLPKYYHGVDTLTISGLTDYEASFLVKTSYKYYQGLLEEIRKEEIPDVGRFRTIIQIVCKLEHLLTQVPSFYVMPDLDKG